MKHLQKLCAAVTLLVVLSFSARAGEITTWGVAPPPPPPASATATEPDEVRAIGTQSPLESETLVTDITLAFTALNLLRMRDRVLELA